MRRHKSKKTLPANNESGPHRDSSRKQKAVNGKPDGPGGRAGQGKLCKRLHNTEVAVLRSGPMVVSVVLSMRVRRLREDCLRKGSGK